MPKEFNPDGNVPEPDEFGQVPPKQTPPDQIIPGDPDFGGHYNDLPPFEPNYSKPFYVEPENINPYPRLGLEHFRNLYEKGYEIRKPKVRFRIIEDSLEDYKIINLPFAGQGLDSKKPDIPDAEPVVDPDPYPSRAGWRTAFLGEYKPTATVANTHKPKVKIGEYEAIESDISFEDVGGNERAKNILMEIAEQFADPDVHSKWDDPIPKGVLLYGQPGTGKTMVAKAFAKEAEAVFIAVPVAQLRDKFYGETEKNLTDLFAEAGKRKEPVVIFFDEIDSLLPDRTGVPPSHPDSQMVNAFLQAMDGMKSAKNVMVLGATNYPESLDTAAIRPGRFDRKIKVELPDKQACGEILARRLLSAERKVGRPLVDDVLDIEKLSSYLNGMSGAEIAGVVDRVKNTMARTERAMKQSKDVADAGISFDTSDVGNLLITTDDIIPAIINYRQNG